MEYPIKLFSNIAICFLKEILFVRSEFSATVKRNLQLIARNRCMICSCPTNKPRISHIIPAAQNGPRSEFRHLYTEKFITSPENGLSLCNECHDVIDDPDLNIYSVDELFNFNNQSREKFDLEEEYKKQLGISDIGHFNELKNFYTLLLNRLDLTDDEIELIIQKNDDFKKIDYIKKMKKNEFLPRQTRRIKQLYASELFILKEQIEENPIIAIKIAAAVRILYLRLSEKFSNQSDIYDKMLEHMYDTSHQKIGNEIILTYYFVICEVFIK